MNITLVMIVISTFCGMIALDLAIIRRRSWQCAFWCLLSALLLTIAVGFGDEFLHQGTSCSCETFEHRFNFTIPLYPIDDHRRFRSRVA